MVGSGFTQMPRLLSRISDPHRPTLIRINDEEHGLQVCRQETGPGPIPCNLTQERCWPYLHGRVRTTLALGTAFASSASQELLLFSSHSNFQVLAYFLKNKEIKPKISSFYLFIFLFFIMIFFFNFIFKLYIIVLVLPNIKMNPPQVYM